MCFSNHLITASGTTLDPVLHFILYVPSDSNRPMKVQKLGSFSSLLAYLLSSDRPKHSPADGSTTQSFITPQRGGLTIYNPSSFSPSSFDSSFRTFSSQFRRLIGLPSHSKSGEIERLIESRSRESLRDALDTLGDLIRLTEEQPNMSVTKLVQSRVLLALDLLDRVRSFTSPPSIFSLSRFSLRIRLANSLQLDRSTSSLERNN